jgi:dGTPase
MLSQKALEDLLESRLAPYAIHARTSRGRSHPDHDTGYRALYQRDRDRIVHSASFRRLQYKTQVFVSVMEGDYYRNRLTHTLEVTQIARTVARALSLNEDLTEALALVHDVGHGPFGHSGESALNEVMREKGGFNHNLQGLRIVDLLEHRYARFPGLNLTYETREGFSKNLGDYRDRAGFMVEESPSLEVQLAGHADEIAYDTHDIEDGLVSGVIDEAALDELELWRDAGYQLLSESPELKTDQRLRWRSCVRRLISRLVNDLIAGTETALKQHKIQTLSDVRACKTPLVIFSERLAPQKRKLEDFLHRKFYNHPIVREKTALWQKRLKQLFGAYQSDPSKLPQDELKRVDSEGETLERIICDYVAGMTDRYAAKQWEALVGSGIPARTQPPAFTFRPAIAEDKQYLYELNRETMREYFAEAWGPWDEKVQYEQFCSYFDPAINQIILVDRRPAGVLSVKHEPGKMLLWEMQIGAEFQRRGIGSAIMSDLCREARLKNVAIELQVMKVNHGARRLYERHGFVVYEENNDYTLMRFTPILSQQPPEYSLRPATKDDAPFVYALDRETMRDVVAKTWGEWNEAVQLKFFNERFDPARLQIVLVKNDLAGILSVVRETNRTFLRDIQIQTRLQNRGIGTQIIQRVKRDAAALKLPLELQVLKPNDLARRLYERLGFIRYGETQTHILMRATP